MAQKALGKAWKSGAEGESLKLLKESGAIFSLRTLFHLRLPRHSDEGEQDGDDGFLVHIHFVLFHLLQQLDEIIEVARVNIQVEQVAVAVEELVGRP